MLILPPRPLVEPRCRSYGFPVVPPCWPIILPLSWVTPPCLPLLCPPPRLYGPNCQSYLSFPPGSTHPVRRSYHPTHRVCGPACQSHCPARGSHRLVCRMPTLHAGPNCDTVTPAAGCATPPAGHVAPAASPTAPSAGCDTLPTICAVIPAKCSAVAHSHATLPAAHIAHDRQSYRLVCPLSTQALFMSGRGGAIMTRRHCQE